MKLRSLGVAGLMLLLCGCKPAAVWNTPTANIIGGEYRVIKPVTSANTTPIHFEQVISFSCVHCFQAVKELEQIRKNWQGKIKIETLPIAFSGGSDLALRLFLIGRGKVDENVLIARIFAAAFEQKRSLSDPVNVQAVANELGIGPEYKQHSHAVWVDQAIADARQRAARYDLSQTPTWVVNKQLIVRPSIDNLSQVLSAFSPTKQ